MSGHNEMIETREEKRLRERREYLKEYYRRNREKYQERYQEKRTELVEAQAKRNKIKREKLGKIYKIKKSEHEVEDFCSFIVGNPDITKEDIMNFFHVKPDEPKVGDFK